MRHDETAPSSEQLDDYCHGRLDAETHRRVEAWVLAHAEDTREAPGAYGLAQVWHDTAPAEPSDAAWGAVLVRLHAAADKPQLRSRSMLRWALGVGTTAAAIWLAFALLSPTRSTVGEDASTDETWETLVLASPRDVEILSVAADDRDALLVGDPPLHEALVLASADDVALQSVEPDVDGVVPDMSGMGGQFPPMIIVPLPVAPPRDADR